MLRLAGLVVALVSLGGCSEDCSTPAEADSGQAPEPPAIEDLRGFRANFEERNGEWWPRCEDAEEIVSGENPKRACPDEAAYIDIEDGRPRQWRVVFPDGSFTVGSVGQKPGVAGYIIDAAGTRMGAMRPEAHCVTTCWSLHQGCDMAAGSCDVEIRDPY